MPTLSSQNILSIPISPMNPLTGGRPPEQVSLKTMQNILNIKKSIPLGKPIDRVPSMTANVIVSSFLSNNHHGPNPCLINLHGGTLTQEISQQWLIKIINLLQ